MTESAPEFAEFGTGHRIAVLQTDGDDSQPGLIWLGGFKSSMDGTKAVALAAWAKERDLTCTRFDYSGHGASGGEFADGSISSWLHESLGVFRTRTSGPQIVIGSSMGGWLSLLL